MKNTTPHGQLSLFEEALFTGNEPKNASQWARKMALYQEELRVGKWDYERLIVNRDLYTERVKKYRGVKNFNHRLNEYEAIEARNVIRFLNNWSEREQRLIRLIEECESEIRRLL